jgi:hypothetical protein
MRPRVQRKRDGTVVHALSRGYEGDLSPNNLDKGREKKQGRWVAEPNALSSAIGAKPRCVRKTADRK